MTVEARQARQAAYRALADAGVPDDRVAQVERLVSTAVLGFAVSEAAGRFRDHSRYQLDADFAALQALLARFIEAQAAKEPRADRLVEPVVASGKTIMHDQDLAWRISAPRHSDGDASMFAEPKKRHNYSCRGSCLACSAAEGRPPWRVVKA